MGSSLAKSDLHNVGNVDENAKAWHHHLDAAKQYFQESIETRIQALAEVKKLNKELDEEKSSAIEADIDYAKRALQKTMRRR